MGRCAALAELSVLERTVRSLAQGCVSILLRAPGSRFSRKGNVPGKCPRGSPRSVARAARGSVRRPLVTPGIPGVGVGRLRFHCPGLGLGNEAWGGPVPPPARPGSLGRPATRLGPLPARPPPARSCRCTSLSPRCRPFAGRLPPPSQAVPALTQGSHTRDRPADPAAVLET